MVLVRMAGMMRSVAEEKLLDAAAANGGEGKPVNLVAALEFYHS